MQKTFKVFLILFIFLGMAGCSSAAQTAAPTSGWLIQVSQAEVKTGLKTREVVTLYNGEKKDVDHVSDPAAGKVYLLLNLGIAKSTTGNTSFEWKDLAVEDQNGGKYSRLENDSFITQHNYSPRMTGLTIRFGENKGWICFEIPKTAAEGKLSLVHTTTEGTQRLEIKK